MTFMFCLDILLHLSIHVITVNILISSICKHLHVGLGKNIIKRPRFQKHICILYSCTILATTQYTINGLMYLLSISLILCTLQAKVSLALWNRINEGTGVRKGGGCTKIVQGKTNDFSWPKSIIFDLSDRKVEKIMHSVKEAFNII